MNAFNDNDSSAGGAPIPQGDDAVQMPLGLGEGGFDADLTDAGPTAGSGEGRGRAFLPLIVIVLVAFGTLYGMRVTGGIDGSDREAAAAEKKIELALKRFTGGADPSDPAVRQSLDALFSDTEDVVARFADDPTRRQVELEHVKKNPFELILAKKPKSENPASAEAVKAIDKVKQQRLKELKQELEKLKLQSVMHGKVALAVVNGKVVREGDTIGSFAITSISPYGVKLAAEGNIYTITMQKPSTD